MAFVLRSEHLARSVSGNFSSTVERTINKHRHVVTERPLPRSRAEVPSLPRSCSPRSAVHGCNAMTQVSGVWKQSWLRVALFVCAATATTTLAANAQESARRIRYTAPPAQAPATVTAQGRTGRVDLEWSSVGQASGYRVFRGIAGVFGPEPIATTSRRHFSDLGLTNGVVHSYKIAAFNRVGAGPLSAVASVTPLAPPAQVTATPGQQQVSLKWLGLTGATGYIVYRSIADQAPQVVAPNVTTTMFVDTGLVNGTRYVYRVRAVATNSRSARSESASATPAGSTVTPPATAPGLTATGGNGLIDLSWGMVTGATGYKLFRLNAGVVVMPPIATVAALTYRHQPLTNGTSVSYQMAATNSAGDGPLSSTASATPVAPQTAPAPTNLTAVGGDARVTLSWSAVAGATGYRVYRGIMSNTQGTTSLEPSPTVATFIDTNVTNGITYFYKVTAMVTGAESARLTEASATPTAATTIDLDTLSAFRLLRQSTWGPKPGDVNRVKTMGAPAFVDEQLGIAPSHTPTRSSRKAWRWPRSTCCKWP